MALCGVGVGCLALRGVELLGSVSRCFVYCRLASRGFAFVLECMIEFYLENLFLGEVSFSCSIGGIYCFDVGGSVCVFFNDCNGALCFCPSRRPFFLFTTS